VEVRVGPYGMGMNKVGVGHFAMSYQLGPIPPAFRGDYTMTIIARNTRGDTATRTIALTVR
jgi:hypothetical protein